MNAAANDGRTDDLMNGYMFFCGQYVTFTANAAETRIIGRYWKR
jgi:hypothetical protein